MVIFHSYVTNYPSRVLQSYSRNAPGMGSHALRFKACVHPGCSMDNWILRRPATSDHEVAGKTKWLLILAIYNGNNMIYWDYWDNIMGIYIYILYMLYWNNILEYSWQQQWVIQIIWPVDKLFGLNGSWTPSGYSITSQIMWVYNPCYWNQS